MTKLGRRTLIASGLAAFAAGPALAAGKAAPAEAGVLAPAAGDMSIGAAKAKLTVVEYLSASCPHCARFNNTVFPDLRKRYVDTGKVRWVLREFLTPPQEVAAAGFLLARAAGPGHYFEFLDDIYHRMDEMYADGTARNAGPVLLSIAGKFGLDLAACQAAVDDKAANQALELRVKAAFEQGVTGTPTIIVGGQRFVGEVALDQVAAAIDAALKGRRRG